MPSNISEPAKATNLYKRFSAVLDQESIDRFKGDFKKINSESIKKEKIKHSNTYANQQETPITLNMNVENPKEIEAFEIPNQNISIKLKPKEDKNTKKMNGVVNSIITSSHFDTFKNQLYAINTNFIVGNPDEIDNNNDTRVVTGSSNENFVLNGKLNPSTVSITHVRPAIMKDKST